MVPRCLDWSLLAQRICQCFAQTWLKKYKETLETVELDLQRNLDILNMLRRMKMHGFALSVLLDQPSRRFISNASMDKPLEYVKEVTNNKPKMLWLQFEQMSRPEKTMIAIFTRYLAIKSLEKVHTSYRNATPRGLNNSCGENQSLQLSATHLSNSLSKKINYKEKKLRPTI